MIKLGKYKHYKGKEYRVLGVAKHSETLEDLVIYEALYDNEVSKLWARPLANFLEEVGIKDPTSDGATKKVPRYEYLGE